MTLIVGARCRDGVILAADRRRLARYEKGPETIKLFKLNCGVILAGAGDDAVLNEARLLIEQRVEESRDESLHMKLFDILGITMRTVNELVGLYQNKVEEPFGYVLAGLENINDGKAKLFTIFGAGLSDVPWICLGSCSSYARPLVDLLLADGCLNTGDAIKVIPTVFSLVSSVQTTVGGEVDICVVKDGEGIGAIQHYEEINLQPLKTAVLHSLGIHA
jgi:20S proteasome alpha/beta subunit